MNTQEKQIFRIVLLFILAGVSSLGLTGGFMQFTAGLGFQAEWLVYVAAILSIGVQLWEMDWFLYPKESSVVEHILISLILCGDVMLVFILFGGHVTIEAILAGAATTANRVLNFIFLFVKCVIAVAVAVGPEIMAKKILGVQGADAVQHLIGQIRSQFTPTPR